MAGWSGSRATRSRTGGASTVGSCRPSDIGDRIEEAAEDDPEGDALRRLGADDVRRQLGVLTAREREAVALRFGGELNSSEVAAVLGVTPSAARMLVHRAIAGFGR